jgi:hypothetical protein
MKKPIPICLIKNIVAIFCDIVFVSKFAFLIDSRSYMENPSMPFGYHNIAASILPVNLRYFHYVVIFSIIPHLI